MNAALELKKRRLRRPRRQRQDVLVAWAASLVGSGLALFALALIYLHSH